MGANAQTSVLDFTNGQVLTGPEMDISAGTGVPVFATTVTRDAAFGGSNKVLAEGQTCYLESTNVVQYYDGAAWATVGPTAAGGLVPITPTSIAVGGGTATSAGNGQVTFTSVTTSLSLNGVFSALYTNYRIVLFAEAASAAMGLSIRMRVGGTNDSSGSYDSQQVYAVGATPYAQQPANTTAWNVQIGATQVHVSAFDIYRPFLAQPTSGIYTFSEQASLVTVGVVNVGGMLHDESTSYDGISFLVGVGITGTVSVYGYAK